MRHLRRGYTLAELIIVIGILGLAGALLVPRFALGLRSVRGPLRGTCRKPRVCLVLLLYFLMSVVN